MATVEVLNDSIGGGMWLGVMGAIGKVGGLAAEG